MGILRMEGWKIGRMDEMEWENGKITAQSLNHFHSSILPGSTLLLTPERKTAR
jgi:hypothetical protein